MIPISNLSHIASAIKHTTPYFQLIHSDTTIMIHVPILIGRSKSLTEDIINGKFSYKIDNRDVPIKLLVECLYGYVDKCSFENITNNEFQSLITELLDMDIKFLFSGQKASFIKRMIDEYAWFRGMTRSDKEEFYKLVIDESDDILSVQDLYDNYKLYNWAKNTKFMDWNTFTAHLMIKFESEEKEAESNPYKLYKYSWYVYNHITLPNAFIYDIPIESIRQIWKNSTNFWILIMMGISDYQFTSYREKYPTHDYYHDELFIDRCEKVRNGYIGAKEVKKLRDGIGENGSSLYKYDAYWHQVACLLLWEIARGNVNTNNLDFVEYLVELSIDESL